VKKTLTAVSSSKKLCCKELHLAETITCVGIVHTSQEGGYIFPGVAGSVPKPTSHFPPHYFCICKEDAGVEQ
jgi:hypothetical protein